MTPNRIAFIIRNVGDYHAPRLLRLQQDIQAEGGEMLTIEASRTSAFYNHPQSRAGALRKKLNIKELDARTLVSTSLTLLAALVCFKPRAMFVLGYNDELSLTALTLSKLTNARIFFLCDSKSDDHFRRRLAERMKGQLVCLFDGAIVAGSRHKKYFASLGLDEANIRIGYDVVDNDFFAKRAALFRSKRTLLRHSELLKTKYVLCVSRLVPRKRVDLAIRVFAESGLAAGGFRLLIVGEGPERERLQQLISSSKLGRDVVLCGAVRNSRMPCYYAYASALVLASEYDQWGLAVNEAMASGVPALVTERCGCAGEILIDNLNGFVWDGQTPEKGAKLLAQIVLDEARHQAFVDAGLNIISQWGLSLFSRSLRSLMATPKFASNS